MVDIKNKKNGFDWEMFKRLLVLLKIIFPKIASIPSCLFFLLLNISFLEQYVGYHVGLIASRYYKVLGDHDFPAFLQTTLTSSLLAVAMGLVITTKTYIANVLYISWRQILCQALHQLYFSGINYYSINVLNKVLDNPDQRMTQDADRFCKLLSTISITVIIAPFTISYYTYKTYEGTGWTGPLGVFGYFCIGTLINKLVMSPIVKFFMEQEKREGDFRFKHMHVRVNSESIAFHVSGPIELYKTDAYLNNLIKSQQTVYNRQYWLNWVNNIYDYLGSIVSYCVIAIPIFTGSYDDIDPTDLSSLISKNAFLCMTLMYNFSKLVDLTSSVVALSGVTHRIYELLDRFHVLQEEWNIQTLAISSSFSNLTKSRQSSLISNLSPNEERSLLSEYHVNEPFIVTNDVFPIKIAFILKDVSIITPGTSRELIKDLNLEIKRDSNILIMGPSSCGKSSLLRVLRGLWSAESGTVAHNLPPGPKAVVFLPQKSLMTNGSLFEQVIYPLRADANHPPSLSVCNEMKEWVDKLLLHGLLHRCGGLLTDPEWNWDDVLSPGEMQRVNFMRIFYHRPQYALLDESTSALSLEVEDLLYKECLNLGITLVSVGHRESLIKYHDHILTVVGDGTWKLEEINQHSAKED